MTTTPKRIAINFGWGYVPGLNAVISGAVLTASELGWEIVGIRDGYEGLLFPDRYPDGGLVELTPQVVEGLAGTTGCVVGMAGKRDPFRVRTLNALDQVEEMDRSEALLETIRKEGIDAVISVVGSRALSILWKLSRKGLRTVSVPKSAENDVAATALSFGFNSSLGFAAEMLERARQAAQAARRIGVVEVPGGQAGWLALQAGIAGGADAVLIPEIPYDLGTVAAKLRQKAESGRQYGLVVVAEGARPAAGLETFAQAADPDLKAALSPGATGREGRFVIEGAGQVAAEVARGIQRLTDREAFPLVLGQLVKGGPPTVVDRQLGLAYGAGAVLALKNGQTGVMVVFQPPDLKFVPMAEAINKVRTVPAGSEFIQIARALGIALGN